MFVLTPRVDAPPPTPLRTATDLQFFFSFCTNNRQINDLRKKRRWLYRFLTVRLWLRQWSSRIRCTSCQANIDSINALLSVAPDTGLSLAVCEQQSIICLVLKDFSKYDSLHSKRILPWFSFCSHGCNLLHSVCKYVCYSRIASQGKTTSQRQFAFLPMAILTDNL